MFQEIKDWSNLNPGPVAILSTIAIIIISWLTGFLKFIFNKLFKKEGAHIKAGGNISAGGDILVGNKKIEQTVKNNNSGNIQQAGGDIINNPLQTHRPVIDLDRNMIVSGGPAGNWVEFELVNSGKETAVDIKYYFTYDGIKESFEMIAAINKLISGEKTHKIKFHYTDTDIFKREVNNLKINFEYKDINEKIYHSGRCIKQDKRADGNFNINGHIEDFFIK